MITDYPDSDDDLDREEPDYDQCGFINTRDDPDDDGCDYRSPLGRAGDHHLAEMLRIRMGLKTEEDDEDEQEDEDEVNQWAHEDAKSGGQAVMYATSLNHCITNKVTILLLLTLILFR